MTDWSVYQLEDIVWDDFRGSDDHIVPHSGAHVNDGTVQDGCHKKLLHEVTSVRKSSDCDSVAKDVISEKGGDQMLEQGLWSCTSGVVFPDPCPTDSTKGMASLGSDDGKVFENCFKSNNMDSLPDEFSGHDATRGSNAASIDGRLCQFSVSDISPTNSDLQLFSNEHEVKDSTFLSYYGWPDIGNFDDVEKMFRSCDSTFGQGNTTTTTDDDFSWFPSSSQAIDGSEDALKTGYKSSCSELSTLKNQEAELKFMPVSATPVFDNIDKNNAPNNYGTGLWTMDDSNSASLGYSYSKMLNTSAESKRVSVPMDQRHKIDGGLLVRASPVTLTANGSNEMVNLQGVKNCHQNEGKRNNTCSEYFSGGSFQNSGTAEQFSNRTGSPPNLSVNTTSMTLEVGISTQQELQSTTDTQLKDMVDRTAFGDHLQVQKHRIGGYGDVGRRMELPKVEEGSSMSSVFSDEISLVATGYQQLQHVMEQLDIKTKLCIRDSLYRLARSAEQRNKFGNSNSCIGDNRDKSGALATEESNKSSEFIDMETDTNPIDRSIAHLLFHKPSDTAKGVFTESLTNVSSQPVMPGNPVCQEEVSAEVDTMLLYTDHL